MHLLDLATLPQTCNIKQRKLRTAPGSFLAHDIESWLSDSLNYLCLTHGT